MTKEEFDKVYHEWLNNEWFTGVHPMSEFMRMTAEHFYYLGKMERETTITSLHLCGVDVGKGENKYDIIGRKACDDEMKYYNFRPAIHKVGETSLYFESDNGYAFPQTEESIGSLIDASLASHLLRGEESCDIEVFIRRKQS